MAGPSGGELGDQADTLDPGFVVTHPGLAPPGKSGHQRHHRRAGLNLGQPQVLTPQPRREW